MQLFIPFKESFLTSQRRDTFFNLKVAFHFSLEPRALRFFSFLSRNLINTNRLPDTQHGRTVVLGPGRSYTSSKHLSSALQNLFTVLFPHLVPHHLSFLAVFSWSVCIKKMCLFLASFFALGTKHSIESLRNCPSPSKYLFCFKFERINLYIETHKMEATPCQHLSQSKPKLACSPGDVSLSMTPDALQLGFS